MINNGFSPVHQRERSVGLDVARSLAIGAVLLCHGLVFLYGALFTVGAPVQTTAVLLGYYGVELFFVLSGFLIGDILFRDVVPDPSIRTVGRFFLRRWFRILPAYYAVLFILIALDQMRGTAFLPRWDYIFLLQNYDRAAEHFFPVSWSLTIEHWSYIVAPVVLVWLPPRFSRLTPSPQRRIWLSLLCIVCLFFFLRFATALLTDAVWDAGIRKQIHLRLDAVFFGVLIVSCKHFRPTLYSCLASLPFFLAVLAGLALLVGFQATTMLAQHNPGGADTALFFKTIGFSLVDLLLALTLPFFADHRLFRAMTLRAPGLSRFFSAGSQYAYSLYLVHYTVFGYLGALLAGVPLFPFPLQVLAVGVGSIVALILSCVAAMVVHRCVEKPGMDVRKHFDTAKVSEILEKNGR